MPATTRAAASATKAQEPSYDADVELPSESDEEAAADFIKVFAGRSKREILNGGRFNWTEHKTKILKHGLQRGYGRGNPPTVKNVIELIDILRLPLYAGRRVAKICIEKLIAQIDTLLSAKGAPGLIQDTDDGLAVSAALRAMAVDGPFSYKEASSLRAREMHAEMNHMFVTPRRNPQISAKQLKDAVMSRLVTKGRITNEDIVKGFKKHGARDETEEDSSGEDGAQCENANENEKPGQSVRIAALEAELKQLRASSASQEKATHQEYKISSRMPAATKPPSSEERSGILQKAKSFQRDPLPSSDGFETVESSVEDGKVRVKEKKRSLTPVLGPSQSLADAVAALPDKVYEEVEMLASIMRKAGVSEDLVMGSVREKVHGFMKGLTPDKPIKSESEIEEDVEADEGCCSEIDAEESMDSGTDSEEDGVDSDDEFVEACTQRLTSSKQLQKLLMAVKAKEDKKAQKQKERAKLAQEQEAKAMGEKKKKAEEATPFVGKGRKKQVHFLKNEQDDENVRLDDILGRRGGTGKQMQKQKQKQKQKSDAIIDETEKEVEKVLRGRKVRMVM